ncbi:hypothetical protein D9M73_151670 [compost metagenome]
MFNFQQLTGFCHDRADQERAEHHAVFKLDHQQAKAETQTEYGDQQHLVALELRHISQQARNQQNADDQGDNHEQRQFADGGEHLA